MRDARTASVEASLQGLIDLAADLLEAPIAAILGAGAPIGPRAEEANALAPFRDRAIARGDVLVVPDAAIDPLADPANRAAVQRARFHEVDALDDTARGSGGFGSTGR